MRYRVPTNLDHTILRTSPIVKGHENYVTLGCREILSCSDCVLYLGVNGNTCAYLNGGFRGILERLIEYEVITKAQALDLILMERK